MAGTIYLQNNISIDDQTRMSHVDHLVPASSLPSSQEEHEAILSMSKIAKMMNLKAWPLQLRGGGSSVTLVRHILLHSIDNF